MRILLFAAFALSAAGHVAGDPPATAKPKPKGESVVKDWKADPACRLVFHAVLQGLYEDGVDDEVVNNIVPADKKGREKMRRSFVLDCPLCQPAFEAFAAYQARPKFSDGSKADKFGKGLPPEIRKGLLSDTVSTRLIALREPMKKWVEARLVSMKLDAKERERWWNDIFARAGQGMTTLRKLNKEDPWYKDWSGYWGCAACLGSQDACRALRK